MTGGTINRHVVVGILMGLMKSDLINYYGMYLSFQSQMDGSNLSIDLWWLHHRQLLLDKYGWTHEHGIYMILLIQ